VGVGQQEHLDGDRPHQQHGRDTGREEGEGDAVEPRQHEGDGSLVGEPGTGGLGEPYRPIQGPVEVHDRERGCPPAAA
jgi:hypothetical protein